jgi:hypothetical protein
MAGLLMRQVAFVDDSEGKENGAEGLPFRAE